jgi:hypothetical protein
MLIYLDLLDIFVPLAAVCLSTVLGLFLAALLSFIHLHFLVLYFWLLHIYSFQPTE